MPWLWRTARKFIVVLSTSVVLFIASGPAAYSKPSSLKKKLELDHQQDPGTPSARPLIDWLAAANQLRERGQMDLNSSAEFTVVATLNSDCRLSDVVETQKSGDHRLFTVVGNLVAAVGDSGLLRYVGDRNNDSSTTPCVQSPLRFRFATDASEIFASFEYPVSSQHGAFVLARAYNALFAAGREMKREHPDQIIYDALDAATDGQQVIVRFRASRTVVDELISRILAGPRAQRRSRQ